METRTPSKGFTLIELLVVISIISMLASIVLASLSQARGRSKAVITALQVREVERAVNQYVLDTGQYPQTCMEGPCTAASDSFSTSLGVPGWQGPYIKLYNLAHPWGGHISFKRGGETSGSPSTATDDADGDGENDYWIFLNDDAPQMLNTDNSGRIPEADMIAIDSILDDGNITTGDMRGNGDGLHGTPWIYQHNALGEMAIKLKLIK